MPPKEVTEVRRLKEKTSVLYRRKNGQDFETGGLEGCKDVPESDFLDMWAVVQADLAAKVGLGQKFADRLTLTGYSVTWNNAGRAQYTPKVAIDFGAGTTFTALPFYLEPDETRKTEGGKVLTKVELENIKHLFELGLAYLKPAGRHQTKLDIKGGSGPGEDAGVEETEAAPEEAPAEPVRERELAAV